MLHCVLAQARETGPEKEPNIRTCPQDVAPVTCCPHAGATLDSLLCSL